MRELAAQTGEDEVILVRLIGRSAVCVHRVESAQRLRIAFEPGQPMPLERGASARLLLAGLTPEQRRSHLAALAERDPEGAPCSSAKPRRPPSRGTRSARRNWRRACGPCPRRCSRASA